MSLLYIVNKGVPFLSKNEMTYQYLVSDKIYIVLAALTI